jgi:hypothetical protein
MSSFVDSSKQMLEPDEIFAIAAKETGGKYTAEQIKATLGAEAYELKGLTIREGNTIFMVHQIPDHGNMGVFRAINADTLDNYVKNSMVFIKAVGLAGFKFLITQFEDKALLNIFKYISKHPPFPEMGYEAHRTVNGNYSVTINLGNPPKQGGLPTDGKQPELGGL